MVSPIRKEMTFRQAKPPIKNSILSNHTPPYIKKDSVSTESLCRYEELIYIIYLLSFIFTVLHFLLLGEDYDTVPVVCAVRLNIRSVIL